MNFDLNLALIEATILLEQTALDGRKIFGTGWLVDMSSTGLRKTALVTAFHVYDQMSATEVKLNWRRKDENGNWHLEPQQQKIRGKNGEPLWHKHQEFDIAVMFINVPNGARKSSIPFSWLADEDALNAYEVGPADELLALGYPQGISANKIGFPILRSGKVASYPITPISKFPTFLMDFAVFAGNSGGPVYMSERLRKRIGANDTHEAHFVMGLLAQQVETSVMRLEIGIVIHAKYIRDALLQLAQKKPAFFGS